MRTFAAVALVAVAGMGALSACSTRPSTTEEQTTLANEVTIALDRFKSQDSGLAAELNKSAGYVVFPDLGKAGVIVGGAYGSGEVFEKGAKVGYAKLSQATIGLQLGGQSFSELIVFNTKEALDNFKDGRFSFAANATAVALKEGAAATSKYEGGAAVFIHVKSGLMAEAAIGGQKFTYRPI